MSRGADDTGDEIAELRARLARLAARATPLEEALADFEHRSRRLADRQERAGGGDREASREQGLVAGSLKLFERELAALRAEQAALERRLAEID